jgi:hypothetical protein
LNPGALGQKDWACRHCQMYHATRIQNPFSCDIQIPLHHSPRLGRLTGFFVNRYTDRCPIPRSLPLHPIQRCGTSRCSVFLFPIRKFLTMLPTKYHPTLCSWFHTTSSLPPHGTSSWSTQASTPSLGPQTSTLYMPLRIASHCLALLPQPSLLTL